MSTRSATTLGVCLIVCCLILGHYFAPPLAAENAQIKGAASPSAGRYQIVPALVNNQSSLLLLDTATGQCWRRNVLKAAGSEWEGCGPPVAVKAAD